MSLLNDEKLENSPVVANCRMNRERQAIGVNSYEKDLKLNPILFLKKKLETQSQVTWLDLCCGKGKALIQTAQYFEKTDFKDKISLEGIDLVDFFEPIPQNISFLQFQTLNLSSWKPKREYDLITCVHGLHYVGDKLGLIQKSIAALTPTGFWMAHLDEQNIQMNDRAFNLNVWAKKNDLIYKPKKHLLLCEGKKNIEKDWLYLGADDSIGANYTGQEAINSYYQEANF